MCNYISWKDSFQHIYTFTFQTCPVYIDYLHFLIQPVVRILLASLNSKCIKYANSMNGHIWQTSILFTLAGTEDASNAAICQNF